MNTYNYTKLKRLTKELITHLRCWNIVFGEKIPSNIIRMLIHYWKYLLQNRNDVLSSRVDNALVDTRWVHGYLRVANQALYGSGLTIFGLYLLPTNETVGTRLTAA